MAEGWEEGEAEGAEGVDSVKFETELRVILPEFGKK